MKVWLGNICLMWCSQSRRGWGSYFEPENRSSRLNSSLHPEPGSQRDNLQDPNGPESWWWRITCILCRDSFSRKYSLFYFIHVYYSDFTSYIQFFCHFCFWICQHHHISNMLNLLMLLKKIDMLQHVNDGVGAENF